MKKKVIPLVFSLFLLASCGSDKCENHDFGSWNVTKEAKCGEAGSRERVCKICNEKETETISALEHDFKTAADQTGAKSATCKEKGTIITECTKCGAKSTNDVEKVSAHNFVEAEDQTGAKAPTCKEDGTIITVCSICGDKSTKIAPKLDTHTYGDWTVTTEASHTAKGSRKRVCSVCAKEDVEDIEKVVEHQFGSEATHVNADHDLIAYDIYTCSADNVRKFVWNANDVTDDTKNEKYNNEDNYKVSGDGIKFGGHPKGNQINGGVSAPTYNFDENVPGSFIEYKINTAVQMAGAQLSAEMASAQYLDTTAGLFLNAEKGKDWTPGLVKDTTVTEGYSIPQFRMDVYVNGKLVTMDASKNIAGQQQYNKGWYDFPCTVDLKAGVNTIKIVQAGGWEPTFYNFAVTSAEGVLNPIPAISEGYELSFKKDEHVTGVKVYEDKACTKQDNGDTYYSRVDTGRKSKAGDGQISFAVECEEGYQVKSITPKSLNGVGKDAYKNIKGPHETCLDTEVDDVFRITKISDDLSIEIVTEPVDTVYEGFNVTFKAGDEHVTIEVYNSKVYAPEYKIEGLTAVSLDETFARPTKTDGQVYFKLIFDEGYGYAEKNVESSVKKAYKAIKGFDDTEVVDGYRLTKVAADTTITIRSEKL